ncbi:hypothetical protein [uncultured Methanobrevibacter sp.]|uniref:hypothetical protein n=1 Tax=uncultured Methanobrevibacter sp. TaxID=253161 RepID=UPI0025D2874B|nr:hypothetical protein [uncultured Methanobrevibacter sp.]
MKKRIFLISLLFIISIGFASASENITDMQTADEIINDGPAISDESPVDVPSAYYVNNTKESSGDGSSWENASKSISLKDNATIYLAEGEYEIPGDHVNVTYIGLGEDTIITSFSFKQSYYFNTNHTVTVINATFKPYTQVCGILQDGVPVNVLYNVLVDEMDFKFVSCTFIDSEFLARTYERSTPNRDTLTDVITASFENCTFKDYNGNYLINNWDFSKFNFNECTFENITADAIVDSYGGRSDSQGRFDGVYIYNSTFKNCNIQGIVKARQLGSCEIVDCTYDFDASETVDLVSPFYVNKTIKSADLNETQLTVTAKDNSVIITLTDVNTNKPIAGVEVAIINNNKVFAYRDTDSNGQIVLDNLLGTYNFEFSYPGDPYAYLPTSVNKTLTFNKTKSNAVIQAPKVAAIYNVAKNLVITLKDSNGNALFGKYVTVKVGSVSKRLKTDKNGKVSLNVATLVPKAYVASISFAGDDDYNKASSTVKVVVSKAVPKLSAKAKTFKKSVKVKKYKVTLKNNLNKVLKNVKLTVKVNKRTYSAKTNSKGVATFKITKLTKKGTFKAKVSFKGSSLYKAVSKSVKIKVK